MNLTTTAAYAGLLGMLFFALSLNVIRRRRSERIGLGHGGSERLCHQGAGEFR